LTFYQTYANNRNRKIIKTKNRNNKMRTETAPRPMQDPPEELHWHTPGESNLTPERGTDADVDTETPTIETSPDTTQNGSQETAPAAINPSEANVANAKARVEIYRNEGARLGEIGKAISKTAIESGKIGLGFASIKTQAAWASIKNRAQQYQVYRAHGAALKENAAREKAARDAQDEAYASYESNIEAAEWNAEAISEVNRLRDVEVGDAKAFNATEEGLTANQASAREAAKNYVVGQAHEEALTLNTQYDTAYENQKTWINAADERKDPKWMATPINFNDVQRSAVDRANREMLDARYEEALLEAEARQEREDAEYDKAREEAEDFLEQFKGKKDVSITDVRRLYKEKFGTTNSEHIQAAYDEAFSVFIGTKKPAAIRAARIKKSREKITKLRREAVKASGDRVSETYQKAHSLTSRIGKAMGRFANRTAKAAGAARDAWRESKPVSPATESEPSTNE
jgi:hypothetical protein